MKNLVQRTVSGILYLVIIIGSLLMGKYTFGALFMIVMLISLTEFYNLMGIQTKLITVSGWLSGAGMFLLAFLASAGFMEMQYVALAAVFPVISLIAGLYSRSTDAVKELAFLWLGVIYIAVPLSLVNFLVFPPGNGYLYTHRIVLGIMILVWINDTGAYVTGMTLGRHKLFPRISPKKSWEGLAGGTAFTLIAAIWMNRIMGILPCSDWIALAVIVSIFGIYGDLTESLLKRNADKKDSGNLIPGHGGILDRFDSLLFVVPAALVYLLLRGI